MCGKRRTRKSWESRTSGRVRSPFSAKPWGCHLRQGFDAMLRRHRQGMTRETAEATLPKRPAPRACLLFLISHGCCLRMNGRFAPQAAIAIILRFSREEICSAVGLALPSWQSLDSLISRRTRRVQTDSKRPFQNVEGACPLRGIGPPIKGI
jgi:hypothetical protein